MLLLVCFGYCLGLLLWLLVFFFFFSLASLFGNILYLALENLCVLCINVFLFGSIKYLLVLKKLHDLQAEKSHEAYVVYNFTLA